MTPIVQHLPPSHEAYAHVVAATTSPVDAQRIAAPDGNSATLIGTLRFMPYVS